MSSISLRSVLIDTSRSRIISARNQRTGIVTEYPARKSFRRLIAACAGVSVLAVVAARIFS